ncbi:MAG: ferrous iron transport protein A [Campylobacterales bacterium]|nr:ferrous iron transport protein A [Campylobacterales bacterium]
MTLNEIETNKTALIKKITASGKLLQKLYDMGFIEGNSLKLIRKSPLGDPIEVEILSYNITLRIQESKCIEVIYE